MKCLAIVLLFIGLSLAMPVVNATLKPDDDLLDHYSLLQVVAQHYRQQIGQQQAKIEARKIDPFVRICCTNMGLRIPMCRTICRRERNMVPRPPLRTSPFRTRRPQFQAQAQGISQLLPLFTDLVRSVPSLRRLVTGFISEFSSYVNQTQTDFTLADILNVVRKGSKDFDTQMSQIIPTVLNRIRNFMYRSDDDESPTVTVQETTGPSLTTKPVLDENTMNKLIEQAISDLPSNLAVLVREGLGKRWSKTQAIVPPTKLNSRKIVRDPAKNLCVLLNLEGESLTNCLDRANLKPAQVGDKSLDTTATISLPNEGQGFTSPPRSTEEVAINQEQQPDPDADQTELDLMQELEQALSDLEENQ